MARVDGPECLSDQVILDLLEDNLTPEVTSRSEDHIEVCDRCKDKLHRLAADPDEMRRAPWLEDLETHTPLFVSSEPGRPGGEKLQIILPPADEPGYEGRIDRYLIEGELGHGAMGVVFLARDPEMDRRVAVKVLYPELALFSDFRSRFKREAQSVSHISHWNVVRIYDAQDSSADFSLPYIVMEYVDGGSLKERITPQRGKGAAGILLKDAASYALEVAEGLTELHRHGVEHRDVKPSNIFFGKDGSVKIADFGLTRGVENVDEALTCHGGIMGTTAYLAPERIINPRVVSLAGDQFSLGIVMYEMVTGQRPFGRGKVDSVDSVHQQILHHVPDLPRVLNPDILRDLETIILVCLEKDPRRRYPSMDALATDLRLFLSGQPIRHRRPKRLSDLLPRNRGLLTAAVAALLLIAALGTFLGTNLTRLRREYIVRHLPQQLASYPFDSAAKDAIEADLVTLDRLDAPLAGEWRVQYFDRLIQFKFNLESTTFEAGDAARLDRCLSLVAERTPDQLRRLCDPKKVAWFRKVLARYARSGSLYAFIRSDSDRIANLEKFVQFEKRFVPKEDGVNGKQLVPEEDNINTKRELLRAYMVRSNADSHDPDNAVKVACGLLDGSLSPAWRMIVLRDYVWMGIMLKDEYPRILDDARTRLDWALKPDLNAPSVFVPLLVERARVLATLGLFEYARADMKRYFREVSPDRIEFQAEQTTDKLLGDGPPQENVPALFYLEACLLYGFLLESVPDKTNAEEYWRTGYRAAGITPSGAYYEAAVLGSLCGRISEKDADNMVTHTVVSADPNGKDVAAQAVSYLTASYKQVVAEILNRAWVSSRGRPEAKDIVFRRVLPAIYEHPDQALAVRGIQDGPRRAELSRRQALQREGGGLSLGAHQRLAQGIHGRRFAQQGCRTDRRPRVRARRSAFGAHGWHTREPGPG